jgi:hypothetical protein
MFFLEKFIITNLVKIFYVYIEFGGIVLQAGGSRVRLPMRLLDFFQLT